MEKVDEHSELDLFEFIESHVTEELEKSNEQLADIRSFQSTFKQIQRTPKIIRMLLQSEFAFVGVVDACSVKKPSLLLNEEWFESSFVVVDYANPEAWLKKAYEECSKQKVVVCLAPARTSASWFHSEALEKANEIRFVKGRVNFKIDDSVRSTPTPDVLVIYRSHKKIVKSMNAVVSCTIKSNGTTFETQK
jgi:hypothetical protein